MTNNTYNHIFSVKFEHTYFSNSICSCLTASPSGGSEEMIRRFRFKWVKEQNIYKCYGKTVGSIEASLNYVQQVLNEDCFQFELVANQPNFNLITDFPLDWSGIIQYNTGNSSNTLIDEAMVLTPDFGTTLKSASMAHLTVRFKDVLERSQAQPGAEFVIKFTARSTRWNYYIINRNAVQLDNPKITGKEGIEFDGPINTKLENGQEALKFTSGENTLALSEVPLHKFKLINESLNQKNRVMKQSSGKVVLDGLPNPDPNKIEIEQTTNKNIAASDMYVYV